MIGGRTVNFARQERVFASALTVSQESHDGGLTKGTYFRDPYGNSNRALLHLEHRKARRDG